MFRKKLIYSNIIMALGLSYGVANAACTVTGNNLSTDNTLYYCGGNLSAYDQIDITTTTAGKTAPLGGFGIYGNSSNYTLKDLVITTSGSAADGIHTKNGRSIITVENLIITTGGSSADGINIGRESSGSIVTVNGNAEVSTSNGIGIRANASYQNTGVNTIIVKGTTTVNTQGNGNSNSGYGVYAGNDSSYAANDGAKIELQGQTTVVTSGKNAYGVYARGRGYIRLGDIDVTTTNTASQVHGIYATAYRAAIGNTAGDTYAGVIDLLSDVKVTVASGVNAIYATGENAKVASYDSENNTVTSGKFNITGNMTSATGGLIDLNMIDGSSFIGNTTVADASSTLNLTIDGANSLWKMDADSNLTTLNLTNGANVYLSHHTSPVTDMMGENITLTMENLSGNGVFHLRSDVAGTDCSSGSFGDFIRVTGTSSGQHQVFVNDNYSGNAAVDGSERLKIIETADGVAEFELLNANGYVDLGAYKYELVRGDNLRTVYENWWLQAAPVVTPDPEPDPETPVTPPAPPTPPKTDTADHSGNILNINYLLSYVENQTLLQRMGEIRRNRHTEGDVWIRGFAGKLDSFADSSFSGFDMSYDGVQIGADKYVAQDVYIGMMMGMAKADADYAIGNGKTKSYHLGLYGTYKSENGWYVDTIAKVNRIKNNFDAQTGGGYAVNGHGTANGFSLGIEAGKRFYKDDTLSGLYLEPQLQYTYSHQGRSEVKATNGLVTELHRFNSQIGRASVIFGYTALKGETPVDIYLKTGYVREFDGKTGITFNDKAHEAYKFNGNWWDNGIGVSVQVKKHHNFYLEADYSVGNKFDKKQINAGYRYAF